MSSRSHAEFVQWGDEVLADVVRHIRRERHMALTRARHPTCGSPVTASSSPSIPTEEDVEIAAKVADYVAAVMELADHKVGAPSSRSRAPP